VTKAIDIRDYDKKTVNKEIPWKPEDHSFKNVLIKVVTEAKTVLGLVSGLELGESFDFAVDMLKEALEENVSEEGDGNVRLLKGKERPDDPIVSPVDPDARFGAKSNTKKFVGYKANITETVESRFITNISVSKGNAYDGDATINLISWQKRNYGLSPGKLIGDAAYGSGKNRHLVADYGVHMIAPLAEKSPVKGIYPKRMFKFDEKKGVVTCPQGVESYKSTYNQKRCDTSYYFPAQVCSACKCQDKCTTSSKDWRIITIGPWHKETSEAEKFNKTEEYKRLMKKRCQIEPTNSELKRNHGMARARARGLQKVEMQCIFTAVAVNVKRWINGMLEKVKPKRVMWVT